VALFRQGLGELGYVEGRNVLIEYRSAEGRYDRLPDLVADLVGRRVSVIVTTGGAVTALAVKAATSTIPIVFACGDDPVEIGLVASLNRPGGNATGVSFFTLRLEVKRLELLRELMPEAHTLGMLVNPKNSNAERNIHDVQLALASSKQRLYVAEASTEAALDAAFTALVAQGTALSWSPLIHSCLVAAIRSWRWPRSMHYQPSMSGANTWRRAAS
jgi:putative tryptophan/tyrosine transport system substrate-binding protein